MFITLLLLLAANNDLTRIDEAAARAHAAMPSKKDYAKEIDKSLRTASAHLKAAQRAPVRGPNDSYGPNGLIKSFGSHDSKESFVATFQKEVERLEAISKSKAPPKPEYPNFDGTIGRPFGRSVHVVQVISANEAIVTIRTPPPRFSSVELWLHAPTAGWTDKASVGFDHPVMITGTKQYDTALGSTRTIREGRVWTKDEIDRFNNWRPAPKTKDTKREK